MSVKPDLRQRISQLRDALKTLRNDLQAEEGYWLEFQWNRKDEEGELEGNAAGLTQMAMLLLDLAAKEAESAHIHFDKYSNFGEESDAIIACKYRPDLESKNENNAA